MAPEPSKLARRVSEFNRGYCKAVPQLDLTHRFVDRMIHTLFPIKRNCELEPGEVASELEQCKTQLTEILVSIEDTLPYAPEEGTGQFFRKVPEAFEQLVLDAEALTRFDPASSGAEEVILCYPGFYCISVYRLAHILYHLGITVLARVMSEYAHGKTGIDIHPGAAIDSPFFIDHGTGIVIGETAEIGKEVKIYQGVTLGALTVEKSQSHTKRHPTIEDNVIIYAGSTILGGQTVIGHDTIVGGNTWITESILPYSVVYRNHRVMVKNSKEFRAPNDFVI